VSATAIIDALRTRLWLACMLLAVLTVSSLSVSVARMPPASEMLPCHAASGAGGLHHGLDAAHDGAGHASPQPSGDAGHQTPAAPDHAMMACCTLACGHAAIEACPTQIARRATIVASAPGRLAWTWQHAHSRLDRPPRGAA